MQQSHEPHSAAANTLPWVLHAIARTALMKHFSAKHDSALQSDPTRAQIEASDRSRRNPRKKVRVLAMHRLMMHISIYEYEDEDE